MTTDEQIVITKIAQPIHVSINLTAKGDIQYDISVHKETEEDLLETIFRLEKRLREQYKGKLAGEVIH